MTAKINDSDVQRSAAILFATDEGFALPTIACALEIKRICRPDLADIRIVTTDMPADMSTRIQSYLQPKGIHVDIMSQSVFMDFEHADYNQTHVPKSTLARFFLLDYVPANYDRILYLDGDTWPLSDLSSLINADLPAGKFAAAEDTSFYYQNDRGRTGKRVKNYFSGLGIDGSQGYFNAGVLLADTGTWRQLSIDAYNFFRANTKSCLYHDQSALNAVAGTRRVRLAPQWNYLSAYDEWGIRSESPPQLVHFAGGGKPWLFPDHPYADTFNAAFSRLAELQLTHKQFSPEQLKRHMRSQLWHQLKSNTIFLHRRRRRQILFDAINEDALIP